MDGDGYFKIVKRRLHGGDEDWAGYSPQIGIQQLWPGEAVSLFAATFGGRMTKPMTRPGFQAMARCELHTRKAEVATERLLPFLLIKAEQAAILLELCRLKRESKKGVCTFTFQSRRGTTVTRSKPAFSTAQRNAMGLLRERLLELHEGRRLGSALAENRINGVLPISLDAEETLAYLAGIMDSDGSFRVERRRAKGMLGLHYRINMRAAQVAPSAAIDLFAKTFGGHTSLTKSKVANHRDLVSWSIYDRKAEAAIEALFPYLIIKRREAALLLQLRRLKAEGKKGLTEWTHRTRGPGLHIMHKRCYSPEQNAEFERIRLAVQALRPRVPPLGQESVALDAVYLAGSPVSKTSNPFTA